ncbi:diphthamide synthesis DPH2 family protein [Wolffia australiana]
MEEATAAQPPPPAAAAVAAKPPPRRFVKSAIPDSILNDAALNAAISLLPPNYNLEVHKCVHRVRSSSARRVALQFPDGLLIYALPLADILRAFAGAADVLVLAEPTYGACCVDDLAAATLRADLLIHYGHSCLVPVTAARLPTLYVHVDIRVDVARLIAAVATNFAPARTPRLVLAGTVQFNPAVHAAAAALSRTHRFDVVVPQAKPLSAGEVLGCTAPKVKVDGGDGEAVLVFVADGRFHLEAIMIANPKLKAFRYDPYLGVLFREEYDHGGMKAARRRAVEVARAARRWGVVLGTLGRQGSCKVLERVVGKMEEKGMEYTVVLVSELSPARLALFGESVDAWVQIACPRLSIDWGEAFNKPLLTTFELEIALGCVPGWWEKEKRCGPCVTCGSGSGTCAKDEEEEEDYPMDYYAQDGGDWNSSYAKHRLPARSSRGAPSDGGKG